MDKYAVFLMVIMLLIHARGSYYLNELEALQQELHNVPTCTVERVTFPASEKECARIHKAIERRIANEAT